MSELRPNTPARRPEDARPRADAQPPIDPPSPDELEAIERHLCSLPADTGADVRVDPALGVLTVRQAGGGAGVHYAAMPRWSADQWRSRLDAVVQLMRVEGTWPSLLVADRLDRPIGLGEELRREGWLPAHAETVLWVGRASVVPHLDPGLRIEAVQPGRVDDHEALERRIFGFADGAASARREALAEALGSGRLRAYVVRLDDEPVAVARLSQGQGVAGLSGIGVVDEHRGRGIGTLITTVATRAGMALGNRLVWLSVDERDTVATRVYANLGFEPAFRWSRWLAPDGPGARP